MHRYIIGLLAGVALSQLAVALDARAQQPVPKVRPLPPSVKCWPVPTGTAFTISCENGYWQTTMPDGTVMEGNGVLDPNASLQGSRIQIDPGTSRPTGGVIGPEQPSSPGPGQWYYGSPIPQ